MKPINQQVYSILAIVVLYLVSLQSILSFKISSKLDSKKAIPNPDSLTKGEVGLLNPAIEDGPLSESDAIKAMEDYFYTPEKQSVGIITFSENIKNQKLGKLRINSKNMKLYFPTDEEYRNVSKTFFNDTAIAENNEYLANRNKLNLIALSEKPENYEINPYKLILSSNSTFNSTNDEFEFTKKNKNKKNLLELSALHEEEIYVNNLSTLKDQYEKYNRQQYNPYYKFLNYQTYRVANNVGNRFKNNDYYKNSNV